MKRILFIHAFVLTALFSFGQMVQENGDTLYGHEWINPTQNYYSFKIAEDGIYRMNYSILSDAGIPVDQIDHDEFKLYRLGQEQALSVESDLGTMQEGDYIEFFGRKMRDDLHEYIYEGEVSDQLNEKYNLISDSATYVLTWSSGESKRYSKQKYGINPNLEARNAIRNTVGLDGTDRLNKSYDVEPGAHPSRFRENDGFYITATRNYRVASLELPDFDESSDLEGRIKARILNRNSEVLLGVVWNGDTVHQQLLGANERLDLNLAIPTDQMSGSNELIFRSLASNDRFNLVHYAVDFPQFLSAEDPVKYVDAEDLENFNLQFSNVQADFSIYFSDSDTVAIPESINNGETSMYLGEISATKTMGILQDENSINYIDRLNPFPLENLDVEGIDYLIITTKGIFEDDSQEIRDYINYRESQIGGEYRVESVYYEDIEVMFGYGIPRNFLSIKNYLNFLDVNGKLPEKIFIIGKGRSFNDWRSAEDIDNSVFLDAFIPTYGFHGSDNLLNSNDKSLSTLTQIGRLPVTEKEQLRAYLNKVMTFDSIRYINNARAEDVAWQKHVMHLGGGATEQQAIQGFLGNLEDKVNNAVWNGQVTSFFKTSSDPIQNAQSDALKQRINNGVSVITFFGHSSTGSFDFKLEDPSQYKSYGKYPVMYSMGCISGDVHSVIFGLAEQFVLEPNGGAIAYMASSGNAYLSNLNRMAIEHYDQWTNNMDQTIGEMHYEGLERLVGVGSSGMIELREQFMLIGDPAIKMGPIEGKDYTIDYSSFRSRSSEIILNDDSFEVSFDLHSLHRFENENVVLQYELEQDGQWIPLKYDTIEVSQSQMKINQRFDIPEEIQAGVGYFHITVDPFNAIDETPLPKAESNNRLGFSRNVEGYRLLFTKSSSRFLYPTNEAIVTQVNPTFYAQSERLFSSDQKYVFQIDTSATFSSGAMKEDEIFSNGGAIAWSPQITWEEDKVYYIRTILASGTDSIQSWDYRSFLYQPESKKGWNRSHVGQHDQWNLDGIEVDTTGRFSYSGLINEYNIRNLFLIDNNSSPPEITVNNGRIVASFNPKGILMVVIEDNTFEAVVNEDNEFGSSGAGYFYWANPDTTNRDSIMQFMDQRVEEGDYVIFMPIRKAVDTVNFRINEWAEDSIYYGANLFQKLEQEGASQVRNLIENPRPYIFVYRKGEGAIIEVVGDDFYDDIRRTISFSIPQNMGLISSGPVGKSNRFSKLSVAFAEKDTSDIINLELLAFEGSDTIKVSLEDIDPNFQYSIQDTNLIKAEELHINLSLMDTTSNTASQLEHLRVYYEGYPEFYYQDQDSIIWSKTLIAGSDQNIRFSIGNYSNFKSDSLRIRYVLRDQNNTEIIWEQNYPSLDSLEERTVSLSLETGELNGEYELVIELNPEMNQNERVEANNFAVLPFTILQDRTSAFLEVLFNEEILPYGAYVSENPNIDIRFWDYDADFSDLDTSNIRVELQYPQDPNYEYISYVSGDLSFVLQEDLNGAVVTFNPLLSKEGIYSLLVTATDPVGNEYPYEVAFEYQKENFFDAPYFGPNPLDRITYLNMNFEGSQLPTSIRFKMWNALGIQLADMEVLDSYTINLDSNRLLFDFNDRNLTNGWIGAGIYPYSIEYTLEEGRVLEFTGKLVFSP